VVQSVAVEKCTNHFHFVQVLEIAEGLGESGTLK